MESTYKIDDHAQADGRRYVTEKHVVDGVTYTFEYLAGDDHDHTLTMQTRAERLAQELQRRAAAIAEGMNGEIPVTRLEFLRRLFPEERVACRELAKADPYAADFMGMLDATATVSLHDPDTKLGLQYMASQGCLTPERVEDIING